MGRISGADNDPNVKKYGYLLGINEFSKWFGGLLKISSHN